jgi:hypothetical protein
MNETIIPSESESWWIKSCAPHLLNPYQFTVHDIPDFFVVTNLTGVEWSLRGKASLFLDLNQGAS